MKTKEFVKKVEELGYTCGDYRSGMKNLFIRDDYNNSLVWIDTEKMHAVSTDYYGFEQLNDDEKKELLNLTLKYIETPVGEREETKKYYLRLPDFIAEWTRYLNYDKTKEEMFFSNNEAYELKTQFTQEEIDNLPNQEFIKSLIKEEV